MQCRGEWKLARVTSAMSALHVLRATFQSPLQLRGGALLRFTGRCDVYNKLSTDTHTCSVGASGSSPALRTPCLQCMSLRATFQSPLQLRGGALRLFTGYCDGLQQINNRHSHMQCRGEWKLARVTSAMSELPVCADYGVHPWKG